MNRILIIGALLVAVFILVSTVYELGLILSDEPTFKQLYQINDNALNWRFRSIFNLVVIKTTSILTLFFFVYLSVKRLKGNLKYQLQIPYFLILFSFILWSVRYYYLWYKSGFDHYPGFNPYIF